MSAFPDGDGNERNGYGCNMGGRFGRAAAGRNFAAPRERVAIVRAYIIHLAIPSIATLEPDLSR